MFSVSLTFWAEISGILGLVIGIIGLVVTVWTYQKAGLIENVLAGVNVEHLLSSRSPDYIKTLDSFQRRIKRLLKQESPELVSFLAEIQRLCKTIMDKTDTLISGKKHGWHPVKESLNILYTFVTKHLPSANTIQNECDLNTLLQYISALKSDIEIAVKDHKERLV